MEIISKRIAVITIGALVLMVAGCNKRDDTPPPTVYDKPATPAPIEKPSTSKTERKYYSEHLDEALTTWKGCKETFKTLPEAERADCFAARDAWVNQPYVPKAKAP